MKTYFIQNLGKGFLGLALLLALSTNFNVRSAGTYMDIDAGAPPPPATFEEHLQKEERLQKFLRNVSKGRTKEVIAAIESGEFAGNEVSRGGISVLAIATQAGNEPLVKFLKDKGITLPESEETETKTATEEMKE